MKRKLILVLAIAAFFIFSYLHLTMFYGNLGHVFLFVLLLAPCITLLIIGAILLCIKKKRLILEISLVILVVNITSIFPSIMVNSYETSITKKNAQVVINSIEKYHEINNTYPKSLDMLIPKYLKVIPKRVMLLSPDTDLEYYLDSTAEYELIYDNDTVPMVYYSIDKEWYPCPRG